MNYTAIISVGLVAVIEAVALEYVRVDPHQREATETRITLEEAFRMTEKLCPGPTADLAIWAPGRSCFPDGAVCIWHNQCCSNTCSNFRCVP